MHTCANVHCRNIVCKLYTSHMQISEGAVADPGFLERGFICIKVWGFALLILSHFS